jgi:hypothetical protein
MASAVLVLPLRTVVAARLDHIAVIAPSLRDGMVWVRDCLGVVPSVGGAHPQMGTHNMLLRLGTDLFLEVIAIDPNAPRPPQPRWFGLDERDVLHEHWNEGRRLRGMVARTETLADLAGSAADLLGTPMRISRGEREWMFAVRADGRLPLDGAAPYLMDWGPQGPAAPQMRDAGCRLIDLVLETPAPAAVEGVYGRIGLESAPRLRPGPKHKLMAIVETPSGIRLLT